MTQHPIPYIEFLAHFNGSRDYFECHEVLEEYWKDIDPGNRDSHWVGLIQIAVGMYHYRRDNLNGAGRMIRKGTENLKRHRSVMRDLGLDESRLFSILSETEESIAKEMPYRSVSLPIQDPDLLRSVQQWCTHNGYGWSLPSDLTDHELIHRHSRRDRSQVIQEREEALLRKKRN
ncbi:DUF309 domain-containing protein [Rossellomorea marisflavi]|uniref:DUF309 domain-containing protein n=1 Tax=Rossellomorea marisflavi TaxID=189381 RepID=UPI00279C8486|nr:DUF309 domain-containing protein [Rossellomorea marisflavi]UTE74511.1 DUF309 domain-containing protein [Rossellomorea marisflavi]